jgi:hypothetical protein
MRREQENFVSRRAVLPIAAATLASIAVIPAVASAAENPDAALLDLIDRCNEAMDQSDAQAAVYSAAEDRYERAPMPAAMFVRAETDTFPTYIMRKHWRPGDRGEPQGPLCYENESARKYLQNVLRAGKPADRNRASEVLGAWDEWHAENDRRLTAAGLDIAEAENERLSDIAHDLRHELCAMPARTLPGLLAKAAIVARCFGEDETFADYCRDELGQSGETAGGEAVARSIAADLIAMLPGASNA